VLLLCPREASAHRYAGSELERNYVQAGIAQRAVCEAWEAYTLSCGPLYALSASPAGDPRPGAVPV